MLRARTEGLVAVEADGETLVYDTATHRAHRLDALAALVWRGCDGRATPAELAASLAEVQGAPVDVEVVHFALARLARARLLEPTDSLPPAMPRRELLRRLTRAGAAAVAIPLVATLVAPTTLQAQASCLPVGAPCQSNGQCCSGRCIQGDPIRGKECAP